MPEKIEKAVFISVESCEARANPFMCWKDLAKPFQPPRRCCEAGGDLFKCQRRSRKQFSPLWIRCEVAGSLFMCRNDLITQF